MCEVWKYILVGQLCKEVTKIIVRIFVLSSQVWIMKKVQFHILYCGARRVLLTLETLKYHECFFKCRGEGASVQLWVCRRAVLHLRLLQDPNCKGENTVLRAYHRVDRVLSFFSSRRNWNSTTPSTSGECAPPPWFRGRGMRGEGWGPQFQWGDIHCGALGLV